MTTNHENSEATPPTIVVRVQESPAANPGSVLCKAVDIGGVNREGAPVTMTETGDAFPVALAGASPPHAGQYVVAERVGAGGPWTIAPPGRGA